MGRCYLPETWIRNPSATVSVKALAGVLASYADGEFGDQDVWPSPATVSDALGLSARHVQRLSEEGEALGWWSRIHERTRTGGIMLTWRLHYPAFPQSESPTDTERTPMSVSPVQVDTERKPNGHRTDTERTWVSDRRYKGTKDLIQNNTDAPSALKLDLSVPKPIKPKQSGDKASYAETVTVLKLWDKIMTPTNPASDFASERRFMRVACEALRTFEDGAESLQTLLEWAKRDDRYSGIRYPRTWYEWMSKGNLSKVLAAYSNAQGDE